jgi:flavodoxin
MEKKKLADFLIAYYSHSGNTQKIAEQIKELVGGTVFRIEPVEKYPRSYQEVLKVSKIEIENGIRPPLKEKVENFELVLQIGTVLLHHQLPHFSQNMTYLGSV